jgi:hypothetical protein
MEIVPGIRFPGAIVFRPIPAHLWNWRGTGGYRRSSMDCRAFRSLHGAWVDDVLDPSETGSVSGHLAECGACARFDTLARRALMVARNAPQLEVSADFSARLAARIADERRNRISAYKPSHVERVRPVAGSPTWVRVAAAAVIMVGGTVAMRSTTTGGAQMAALLGGSDSAYASDVTDDTTAYPASAFPASAFPPSAFEASVLPASSMSGMPGVSTGQIVVVRSMRPVGGALLPFSDDPLLDGDDRTSRGDMTATSVAATAPLWPTAQMAAHAANRFAAMEFGDVVPVSVMQTSR